MKTLQRLLSNSYCALGAFYVSPFFLGYVLSKNWTPINCNQALWGTLASADMVIVSIWITSFSFISSRIRKEALTKHIQADALRKLVSDMVVILIVGVLLFIGDIWILTSCSCVRFQYGCLFAQIFLLITPMLSLAIRIDYNWLNQYEKEFSEPKYGGKYVASSKYVFLYELLVKFIGDEISNLEWMRYSKEYVRVKYDETAIGAFRDIYNEFCSVIKSSVRVDGSELSFRLNEIINENQNSSEIDKDINKQSKKARHIDWKRVGWWVSIGMLILMAIMTGIAYYKDNVPQGTTWWQSFLIPLIGGFLLSIFIDNQRGIVYSKIKIFMIAIVMTVILEALVSFVILCVIKGFDKDVWDTSIWNFANSLVTGFAIYIGMSLIDYIDKNQQEIKENKDEKGELCEKE